MLRAVCEGIRDALGFELAGVFLDEAGDGRLLPAAGVGFDFVAGLGSFTAGAVERMIAPELVKEGCVLLDSRDGERAGRRGGHADRLRLAQQRPAARTRGTTTG